MKYTQFRSCDVQEQWGNDTGKLWPLRSDKRFAEMLKRMHL